MTTSSESLLLKVLIEIVVIVVAARLVGRLFQKCGQPQVCGEIAAGLLLGPSMLGGFFPQVFQTIFQAEATPLLGVLSQLGLILLMFVIGLECDFDHVNRNGTGVVAIAAAGTIMPFLCGAGIGAILYTVIDVRVPLYGFAMFIGTAISITAVPTLGRILMELGIHRTRSGSIAVAAAAVADTGGWIVLAVVTSLVASRFEALRFVATVAGTIAYAFIAIKIVRPLLLRWIAAWRRRNAPVSASELAVILVALLLSAIITNLIGVFSIFGAFILGASISDQRDFSKQVTGLFNDFASVLLLPVFFTYTGLRVDIGALSSPTMWAWCGLVVTIAVASKYLSCSLTARATGLSAREAASVGVMMNARGLMELVVVNVGYDLGILPKSVFTMLVIMALATTYMTTPLLRLLMRGEIEVRRVGFAAGYGHDAGTV